MNYENVLVTGASRGLGAALARELAVTGRRVLLAARSSEELRARAAEIELVSGRAPDCHVVDLRHPHGARELIAAAKRRLGRIDALINNAGIGPYKPFIEHDEQELGDILALNLLAPMRLARALLPDWIERRTGYLINVASDLARRPLANMAPYVASKFGLLGWATSLHRETRAQGIKVTTVMPGIIDSSFNGSTEGTREPSWALSTSNLAQQVVQLLDSPPHLVIDELTVHPAYGDY
jgi:short-subunit dehydrogenase